MEWLELSTSQLPTLESWLVLLLSSPDPDAVLISARFSTADVGMLLNASARLSKDYSLSACSAQWHPEWGCCSLLLLMAGRSGSPFTTVMTDSEPTSLLRRNLLRHFARYAPVQELVVARKGAPQMGEVKSVLNEPS